MPHNSSSAELPVAIVTGGASGLGAATVRQLTETGYHAVVADLATDVGSNTADRSPSDVPSTLVLHTDVTDSSSVDRMIEDTLSHFGRLDVLVNSAGYSNPSPTHSLDDSTWLQMIDVHLNGTLRCCRSAYPALKEAESPAIVNLSSVASIFGYSMRASYCAAKAGIDGLTRSLASEWGPDGIRVNAVAPGSIDTPLLRGLIESGKTSSELMKRRVPLKRLGTASEIASTITFLATPSSSYITGQTIAIDGGFTIEGTLS